MPVQSPEVSEKTEMMELLLQMAVIDAMQQIHSDFGVLLIEEYGEGLFISGVSGKTEDEVRPLFIPAGKSFSGKLAIERVPKLFTDVGPFLGECEDLVESYYSGSVISAPLFSGEQFMGLINLSRGQGSPFGEEDLESLVDHAWKVSSSIQGQMIIDVRIGELERARDELAETNEQHRSDMRKKIENEKTTMKQSKMLQEKIRALREANNELIQTNRSLLRKNAEATQGAGGGTGVILQFDSGAIIVQGGLIKEANKWFTAMTGMRPDEVEGHGLAGIFPSGMAASLDKAIEEHSGDGIEILDERLRLPDGSGGDQSIRVSIGNIKWHDQPAVFLLFNDVSEEAKAEDRFVQSSKLESVGRLAAGIAHEINTPTQYVGDNTRFLEEAFEEISILLKKYEDLTEAIGRGEDTGGLIKEIQGLAENADLEFLVEEVPRAIQQSLDGIGRVAKIVRSMKEFSHPGSEEKVSSDLNKIIDNTVTVARNEWKYVADLELQLDEELCSVPCVTGEISQCVLNMIINASHAIGDRVESGEIKKGKITISTGEEDGHAFIRISDTGKGMSEDVIARMFDPFYTTKEVGQGTGQGLAISRTVVVDNHDGSIDCESTVGEGTTFTIRLPVDRE